MAREQSSCGRSREAARESEDGSAVGSADEGESVEAEAGQGCRAAGVAGGWPPRGGRALALVRTRRAGTARRSAETGQAHEWARPDAGRASSGCGGRLSRLRPWADKRGGGP